ncbi:MAG: type II secretion system F family protein [Propionibacteriales bacterium]|nr:type II secretion system F family protein [Propionibacteriales bacterium]
MIPAAGAGAILGAAFGAGCWLAASRALVVRRTSIGERVLPYLRDLPTTPVPAAARSRRQAALAVLGTAVDRVLGGAASIRTRLDRSGSTQSVHDFRIEQVVWGLIGFVLCAVPSGLIAVRDPGRGPALFVTCAATFVGGVLLRENRLSAQVRTRERRILEELPVVAELLALAVAAGESPLGALDRVVRRSSGEFARDLRDLIARTRTGMPLAEALDRLGARSGLAPVTRFAHGLAVAVERGTPLADVLHAQAGDVREAARRSLIESGARREVLMMVPVVFLILPTVVVFAFWPGLVGLRLVSG